MNRFKFHFLLILSVMLMFGCGQSTKIYKYNDLAITGFTYGMMQEGEYENRLRIALLNEGVQVSAFHQEVKGSDRIQMNYVPPRYLLKLQVDEDRPCLIGTSRLVYGKLEIIDYKSGTTLYMIEEMGFTEPCIGSEPIYGNVFKKLAISLKNVGKY